MSWSPLALCGKQAIPSLPNSDKANFLDTIPLGAHSEMESCFDATLLQIKEVSLSQLQSLERVRPRHCCHSLSLSVPPHHVAYSLVPQKSMGEVGQPIPFNLTLQHIYFAQSSSTDELEVTYSIDVSPAAWLVIGLQRQTLSLHVRLINFF
jgi:hypothetical protein